MSTQAIVDGGGVGAIVAAMRTHGNSETVCEAGGGVLYGISMSSNAGAQAIVDRGGVVVIVAAMTTHAASALVCEYGCGALRNISAHLGN